MARRDLLLPAGLFTLALLTGACSDSGGGNGGSSDILATAMIGPDGGTLRVSSGTLTDTTLAVPAGAVDELTEFTAELGQRSNIPGLVELGDAVLLEPDALDLLESAQLILPYDPLLLPASIGPREIEIGWRNSTGMVARLPIAAVDESRALVRVTVNRLGTFWPVAPQSAESDSLFPLGAGDTYEFGDGLIVNVARVSDEANLPQVDIAKVSFVQTGITTGIYLDDSAGDLLLLGNFEDGGAQEVFDTATPLLGERVTVGDRDVLVTTYVGYRPLGTSIVDYTGILRSTASVPESQTLSVPAGTFENCFLLTLEIEFNDTRPMVGSRRYELWLAPGVGPVRIRFDDGTSTNLVQATVGGQMIGG